jgi:hypothetical protein
MCSAGAERSLRHRSTGSDSLKKACIVSRLVRRVARWRASRTRVQKDQAEEADARATEYGGAARARPGGPPTQQCSRICSIRRRHATPRFWCPAWRARIRARSGALFKESDPLDPSFDLSTPTGRGANPALSRFRSASSVIPLDRRTRLSAPPHRARLT